MSCTHARACPCAGHENRKHCVFAAFMVTDARARYIVAGSEDGCICLWDLQTKQARRPQHPPVPCASTPVHPPSTCLEQARSLRPAPLLDQHGFNLRPFLHRPCPSLAGARQPCSQQRAQ